MGQPTARLGGFLIEKANLPRLADVLQTPPVTKCTQRGLCDGLFAPVDEYFICSVIYPLHACLIRTKKTGIFTNFVLR